MICKEGRTIKGAGCGKRHGKIIPDAVGLSQEKLDAMSPEEMRQALRELREGCELFSLIMRHSPVYAIIKAVTATESRVLIASENFREMVGISGQDMAGKTMGDLFPAAMAAKITEDDWAVVTCGEVLKQDLDFNGRNYTSIKYPLVQGGETLLAGFIIDITERKLTEKELRETNRRLEIATARANELAARAETASVAKSEFLTNMSHEIRTPLHSVIGMSGVLMSTPLSAEQQDYAETIRVSGESLLSVVNDILDFSKIEAEKLELEKQPFNLMQCVEDAVDVVSAAASRKKLELFYQIDEQLPKGWIGDVTRLRQILVNLLGNAIKFTDGGEVEISVTGQAQDDVRTLLCFKVRDTGVGIPAGSKIRLFEPFSQCDASTTRRFGGTGLGLAICKRLSELMGGTLDVDSPGMPGGGATFRFSAMVEVDPAAREPDPPCDGSVVGKRVLIVACNRAGRGILAQHVLALGMHPVAVGTAQETRAILTGAGQSEKPEPFDLAILDAQLNDMEGVALGREIRALPGGEKTRLIVMSPLGSREFDSSHTLDAEHLFKPVKVSHLYDTVVRLFAAQPSRRRLTEDSPGYFNSEVGRRHPLRILVAEDNVVNQKVAVSILAKLGYRADTVSNGIEAVEAVNRIAYDLVLMDAQMPEMDGEQATVRIRKELPAPLQPWIVAMTADVMKDSRERFRAAGMNDYISKPVRIERLVKVLLSVQPVSSRTGDALPNVGALAERGALAHMQINLIQRLN